MVDPILAGLVDATGRDTALALPVTILTRGVVAEGVLVSEARWLDEMATVLEAGGAGAAVLGGVFRAARVSVELAQVEGDAPGGVVHLVDARLSAGGQLVSVGLWRVQLAAVDGWKLGAALPQRLRVVEG